jgi:hypothetical protein
MAPTVRLDLAQRGYGLDHAGIVDQHVKLAKGGVTGLDRGFHFPVAADIAGDCDGAPADLAGQIRDRVAIARDQRHIRTRRREIPRRGGSDALARAGDQNAFALQCHDLPPVPYDRPPPA